MFAFSFYFKTFYFYSNRLIMNKEFIPYEQALELKELGFDIPSVSGYSYSNSDNLLTQAILYQQVFRWFREKHRLYHDIKMFGDWDKPQYIYIVVGRDDNPKKMYYYEDKDSYEEAELACLNKLIEILKNK